MPSWPAAGPAKGSNAGIALIDYQMAQDPEGKPLPARPVIAVNMPAKISASGEAVSVVLAGFVAQAAVPGPYFVFGPAKIKVDRRSDTDAEGKSIIDEVWEVNAGDGSALQIGLQFTRGALARGKAEAKIHSAAKPEFYRIYRFEQAADLVKSTATGVDRVSKLSFKAAGPKLTSVFDGSEQLISITSIPFYSRSIYVPVMSLDSVLAGCEAGGPRLWAFISIRARREGIGSNRSLKGRVAARAPPRGAR